MLRAKLKRPILRFGCEESGAALRLICGDYLTTDWKSGEVSKLANWLSEDE